MAEMTRGGEGEARDRGFVKVQPGLEALGDDLEKEVDAALDRIGRGPEAPRRRAAISPRLQELANSEMEIRPAPPKPAAGGGEVDPELSWAYRQQLQRAMKRPSPLRAALAGAVVGAVATLIAAGAALSLLGERQAAPLPAAPRPAEPAAAPPKVEIARAAPPLAAPAREAPVPKKAERPQGTKATAGREATAEEDGERPPTDREMEEQFEAEYAAKERAPARTVFIPPPLPSLPEKVSEAEILRVVLAHKPEILACVRQDAEAAPGEKRTLAMRWMIEPDGRTSGVAVATAGLEGSVVGGCLAGEISTWRFPRHRSPQPPIRFPFTY